MFAFPECENLVRWVQTSEQRNSSHVGFPDSVASLPSFHLACSSCFFSSHFLHFPSCLLLFHPPLHPQEPVFSSTFSPPISLGQKCQYIDHHSQVRTRIERSNPKHWGSFHLPVGWELLVFWLHEHNSAWSCHFHCWNRVDYTAQLGHSLSTLECIKSFYMCLVWCSCYMNNCSWEKWGVTWSYSEAVWEMM